MRLVIAHGTLFGQRRYCILIEDAARLLTASSIVYKRLSEKSTAYLPYGLQPAIALPSAKILDRRISTPFYLSVLIMKVLIIGAAGKLPCSPLRTLA